MSAHSAAGAGAGAGPQDAIEVGSLESSQHNANQPPAEGAGSLIAELLAASDLNARQRQVLFDLGVSWEAIRRAGLGVTRIQTAGRTYLPSADGHRHIVQPVWAGSGPSISAGDEQPQLLDLLAWHPDAPDLWLYRVGRPGMVLGEDAYLEAVTAHRPINLHCCPLDWLAGNCHGAVFLDDAESRWDAEREAERLDALEAWRQRFAQ